MNLQDLLIEKKINYENKRNHLVYQTTSHDNKTI